MLGLADIVELFAQARADLDADLGGVDGGIESLAQRKQQMQLLQVGFDRRLHVGILQLARKLGAFQRAGTVHLTERSGGRGLVLEAPEFFLPAGAEFRLHAALDEGPAHRRRLALQLDQFVGVFRRQRVWNGGEQLRHLHDRSFEAAERGGKRQRISGAAAGRAEKALAGDARGNAADLGADARIAPRAGGEAVFLAVVGRHGHSADARDICTLRCNSRSLEWPDAIDKPSRQHIFAHLAGGKAEHHRRCRFRRRIEIETVEAKEDDHRGKRGALVAVDERMIARDSETVGRRQQRNFRLAVTVFIERPRQCRFKQPAIAKPVGAAEESQLLGMKIENRVDIEPLRLGHSASAL